MASYGGGVWNKIVGSINELHERGIIPSNSLHKIVGDGVHTRFWKDAWCLDIPLMRRGIREGVESNQFDDLVELLSPIQLGVLHVKWIWDLDHSGGVESSGFPHVLRIMHGRTRRIRVGIGRSQCVPKARRTKQGGSGMINVSKWVRVQGIRLSQCIPRARSIEQGGSGLANVSRYTGWSGMIVHTGLRRDVTDSRVYIDLNIPASEMNLRIMERDLQSPRLGSNARAWNWRKSTKAFPDVMKLVIDIDENSKYSDFEMEVAKMFNCSLNFMSIKCFLPGNKKLSCRETDTTTGNEYGTKRETEKFKTSRYGYNNIKI
uniref:Uncharacterized protein n=1 Tax=Lactuca sativa TaxID=4236 RepID=A0A9R1VS27_LACSA|nr:hypothetical protein LSAT_V11C400221850 [Lactuca sativa]